MEMRFVFVAILLQYGACSIHGYSDPEIKMTTSQIIAFNGYPVEDHNVETSDGYILNVQRIPGSKTSPRSGGSRPVVLLWHGLLSCSACWVENPLNESLGFILADAGYDVWLGNSRGNTYGRNHKTLSTSHNDFWAFSWDEMAKYDIPATIDYILAHTGQSNLAYVGHSQGTEIMFAAQSMGYVAASKVNLFVALGPAVYLAHVQSPVKALAILPDAVLRLALGSKEILPKSNLLSWLGKEVCSLTLPGLLCEIDLLLLAGDRFVLRLALGSKEILPKSNLLTWLGKEVCSLSLPGLLCENMLFLLAGYDFQNLNQSRIPVYVGQHPAGTSTQNLLHYAQSVRSKQFQMYDYGLFGNMKKYGTIFPPKYHPSKITVPTALFVGPNDWLTTLTDVNRLASEMHSVVYKKVIPNYEHLDYIWAVNAPQVCYADILTLLKRYK